MKANICSIEDHPDVSNAMVLLLERAGCNVAAAQTGAQGFQLACDGDFDLITLDIDVPGINGFEVCQRLKQAPALRHPPIIFVSGRVCDADVEYGLALGAVGYIIKPFEALAFVECVLSHVRKTPINEDSSTCRSN